MFILYDTVNGNGSFIMKIKPEDRTGMKGKYIKYKINILFMSLLQAIGVLLMLETIIFKSFYFP